jgi:hypothetical protein
MTLKGAELYIRSHSSSKHHVTKCHVLKCHTHQYILWYLLRFGMSKILKRLLFCNVPVPYIILKSTSLVRNIGGHYMWC